MTIKSKDEGSVVMRLLWSSINGVKEIDKVERKKGETIQEGLGMTQGQNNELTKEGLVIFSTIFKKYDSERECNNTTQL